MSQYRLNNHYKTVHVWYSRGIDVVRMHISWGQRLDADPPCSQWTEMLLTKLPRPVGALPFCHASQKQTQWCHSIIVAIIANTRASGSVTVVDRANGKFAIPWQQRNARADVESPAGWRTSCDPVGRSGASPLSISLWLYTITVVLLPSWSRHSNVRTFTVSNSVTGAKQHVGLQGPDRGPLWYKLMMCSRALGQTSVIYAIVKTFTPICPQSTAIFQTMTDCSVPSASPAPLSTFLIQ